MGDYIVTSDGARRQFVVGRVNGTYEWCEHSPIQGMRRLPPVEWLDRLDGDGLGGDAITTLVTYPLTILLEITDPALVALDRAVAGDLLPITPPTRVRRMRSTRTHVVQPARGDARLCQECFLWKHVTQFDSDSTICREHTG